ncbi:MAG TPA: hypothetical protein VJ842_18760 [Pyrinomonadaceae bacterium]|nr:hypothetical protein [Pyrinomonadaceae bacterium]
MPSINLQYKRVPADEAKYGKGFSLNSVTKSDYKTFNSSVLGLGDVSKDGKYIQALAAFYDLEGFTSFSNQVDSHLVIPEFLKRFIEWLFTTLAEVFKEGESEDRVRVVGSLPFFSKFLGDGILFLWDTDYSGNQNGIKNIILRLHRITALYTQKFLPEVRKHVSKPPHKLRCGIARGQVISIGDGNDYVGSCINIAARLQKLSHLTFAVSRRGFDLSGEEQKFLKSLILKKVELRGIGSEELVYIKEDEYQGLRTSERKFFKEP